MFNTRSINNEIPHRQRENLCKGGQVSETIELNNSVNQETRLKCEGT